MLMKLERKFLKYCNKNKELYMYNTHLFEEEFYKSFPKFELRQVCESLSLKGYINILSQDMDGGVQFTLTYDGMHYRELSWLEIKSFLLESVLVPIVISLITAIITILITSN